MKRIIDWEAFFSRIVCQGVILLAAGVMLAMASCTNPPAPTTVVSTEASYSSTNQQNSGIVGFYKDHITVDQHWLDRYHAMAKVNSKKPDLVQGKPNPDKVFIVGKEDTGISQRPDGNYDAPYTTLFYFDRLNSSIRANRKT